MSESTYNEDLNLITIDLMGTEGYIGEGTAPQLETPYFSEKKLKEIEEIKRRMRQTTFQARMGKKIDGISQKLIDNQIRLTASPVDMVKISVKRDERTHDILERTITSVEVMPIVMPKIEGIPLRHLIKDGEDTIVPSLVPTQWNNGGDQQYFEIFAPMIMKLDIDDLLFRVIFDEYSDRSYIMALQVKEILGNLGSSAFRMTKYWATLYDNKLPSEVVSSITRIIKKRNALQW